MRAKHHHRCTEGPSWVNHFALHHTEQKIEDGELNPKYIGLAATRFTGDQIIMPPQDHPTRKPVRARPVTEKRTRVKPKIDLRRRARLRTQFAQQYVTQGRILPRKYTGMPRLPAPSDPAIKRAPDGADEVARFHRPIAFSRRHLCQIKMQMICI